MTVASDFLDLTRDWIAQLERDEWFFAKIREDLVSLLPPVSAFEAITDVGHLFIELPDSYLRYETAELLLALAWKSETTEMPAALAQAWSGIAKQLSAISPSTLRSLCSWYRIAAP
jgi:hypothetical protein